MHPELTWRFALGFALVTYACGGELASLSPDYHARVIDSAGIQIVDNGRGPDRMNRWRLSEQPTMTMSTVQPEARPGDLISPRSARRTSRGQIMIADMGASTVNLYGAGGQFLSSVGGRGEGPSEFKYINWFVKWFGDSVAVYDSGNARFTIVADDGSIARTFPVPNAPGLGGFVDGLFADGSLVMGAPGQYEKPRGVGHNAWVRTLHRVRTIGDSVATTALPVSSRLENYFGPLGTRGLLPIPIPYESTNIVQSAGQRLYVANTSEFAIRVYDVEGRLQRIVRRDMDRPSVSSAELDLAKERLYERSNKPEIRASVEASLTKMAYPERVPAFGRWAWEQVSSPRPPVHSLEVDDLGHLWVLNYTSPTQAGRTWTVFDSLGVMQSEVAFPVGFEPWHIGPDFVLGFVADDQEVSAVRMYRLEKNR